MRTIATRKFWLLGLFLCSLTIANAQQSIFDRLPFESPQRQAFYTYLVNLKRGNIEALSLAVDEYERLFSSEPATSCDSAFVLLEDFAMTSLDEISFNYPLLKTAEMPRNEAEKETGDKYRRLLKKNLYRVYSTSMDMIVLPDFRLVRSRIGQYLSKPSQAFFEQADQEEKEVYIKNDSLQISWASLAKRVTFWDNFVRLYPTCVYLPEAIQRRDVYMENFIFGTSISKLCNEKGKMKEEVKLIYQDLSSSLPKESQLRAVLKRYLELLQEKKFNCQDPAVLYFSY